MTEFNVGDKVVLKPAEKYEDNATLPSEMRDHGVFTIAGVETGRVLTVEAPTGQLFHGWFADRFQPAPEAASEATEPTEQQPAEPRTYTQAELDEALSKARAEYHASAEARIGDVRTLLGRAREQHREDIARIGERLQQEAKDRSWCSEYDGAIEELNRDLHVELPLREREYTVTVAVSVEITVNATDEDAAREAARQIADNVESRVDNAEGVSTSRWESSYDYEVTEA